MQLVQQHPFSRYNVFPSFFANPVNNNWPSSAAARTSQARAPAVDITEHETSYKIVVDVPGLTADEIDVAVEKQVLTISGKRHEPEVSGDDKPKPAYTRQERLDGEFVRRFTLPDNVDVEVIKADVNLGVLTVVIPRSEATKLRKISVNG